MASSNSVIYILLCKGLYPQFDVKLDGHFVKRSCCLQNILGLVTCNVLKDFQITNYLHTTNHGF